VDVIPNKDMELYCDPINEAQCKSFNTWLDIRLGSWVLLRLELPQNCVVWQGRALSIVCRLERDVNNRKFLLLY